VIFVIVISALNKLALIVKFDRDRISSGYILRCTKMPHVMHSFRAISPKITAVDRFCLLANATAGRLNIVHSRFALVFIPIFSAATDMA